MLEHEQPQQVALLAANGHFSWAIAQEHLHCGTDLKRGRTIAVSI